MDGFPWIESDVFPSSKDKNDENKQYVLQSFQNVAVPAVVQQSKINKNDPYVQHEM